MFRLATCVLVPPCMMQSPTELTYRDQPRVARLAHTVVQGKSIVSGELWRIDYKGLKTSQRRSDVGVVTNRKGRASFPAVI
jgi:hypothetical protein